MTARPARGDGGETMNAKIRIKAKFESMLGNERTGITNSITFKSKNMMIYFEAKKHEGTKEINPSSPLLKFPDLFHKKFLITIEEAP